MDEEMDRRCCVRVAGGGQWEAARHGRGERAEEEGDHLRLRARQYSGRKDIRDARTYLRRVEDERADVSMRLALDLVDGFGCGDAGDDDVAFLFEIEYEREA